jgi:hypothetical protein
MAYNPNKRAPGDGPNTGAPGFTPAPIKDAEIPGSFGKMDRGNRVGQNQYPGASSLTPGQAAKADGLNIDPPGGDAVRDRLQAKGLRSDKSLPGVAADEMRDIGSHNVATHNAMRNPNAGNATVPGSLVPTPSNPPRKP